MATLNEVMKETADAIREKTGKSDLIAPVNFAEEIKGITAGGGGSGESGGGNEWQYYDMRNNTMTDSEWWGIMNVMPTLVAIAPDVGSVTEKICVAGMISNFSFDNGKEMVKYIAIDMDVKQYGTLGGNQLMSFKEIESQLGVTIADMLAPYGITPITKEQFYTLE